MSKSAKSPVRLFGRDTTQPAGEVIQSAHGPMYPGPEYDHYKRLFDFHKGVQALVSDVQTLNVTRAQALERIAALPYPPSVLTDIEQGLAKLKAGLSGSGETPAGLAQLACGLGVMAYNVSQAASAVPSPPHPDTVQPTQGQPFGSGAYQRWSGY